MCPIREGGGKKVIKTFKQAYQGSKVKLLLRVIRENHSNKHKVTFQEELQTWEYHNRRVGQPKYQWAKKAMETLWEEIRMGTDDLLNVRMDVRDARVKQAIIEKANEESNR